MHRMKGEKKKILVISQFFYPDLLSTGKVMGELFSQITRHNFSVKVVSGRRLYHDNRNIVLPRFELWEQIKIYRVFQSLLPKEKAWGRLYNYLAFFLLACGRVFGSNLSMDINLVFCVSNPPIMPLLGAWLRNDKKKFIYLIHDLYPDIAIKLGVVGRKNIMARVMFAVNRYAFHKADAIIVLGRDMKEYLVENYHVWQDKIYVLPNWSKRLNIQSQCVANRAKYRLLYTGNLGQFHDLEIAVVAAECLPDELEVFFVGEGAKKNLLQFIVSERNIENVKFFGYLGQEEYAHMLSDADALLLSLEKNLSGLAVPSKYYTYLAAGKPVIAITDENSEIALSIHEEKCGIVMKHGDIDFFVANMKRLITNPELSSEMGRNAYNAFEQKYEESIVIKQYEQLFDELCTGGQ